MKNRRKLIISPSVITLKKKGNWFFKLTLIDGTLKIISFRYLILPILNYMKENYSNLKKNEDNMIFPESVIRIVIRIFANHMIRK